MSAVVTARPVFGDLDLINLTTRDMSLDTEEIDGLRELIAWRLHAIKANIAERNKDGVSDAMIRDLDARNDLLAAEIQEMETEADAIEDAMQSRMWCCDRIPWLDPPYGTTAAPSGQPEPEWPDPPYGYPLTGILISEEDDSHL